MDKSMVSCAQRIVNNATEYVNDNPLNRRVQEAVGVGVLTGKKIRYTASDRLAIERYFSGLLKRSLRTIDLKERDRLAVSSFAEDEKWACGDVFESLINVASTSTFHTIHGEMVTPPGCVFSFPLGALKIDKIKKIVILENGAMMTNWCQTENLLPEKYKGALLLYRGHGDNQRGIKNLLSSLHHDTDIGIYYDYDAPGLSMAEGLLNGRTGDLIIPDCDIDTLIKHNKPDAYHKQFDILSTLINHENDEIRAHANILRESRLSIIQERLLINEIQLKTLAINTKK
jgi:hypothetical protein